MLIKDLQEKVYNPIEQAIAHIEYEANNGTYVSMYHHLKIFVKNYYNKLPHDTTKAQIWKDAFKGSGAFYTLQNTIRFTGMILEGCTNRYKSEKKLYELLDEYKGEEWRLHKVLVDAIEYNNYNLAERITMYNKEK